MRVSKTTGWDVLRNRLIRDIEKRELKLTNILAQLIIKGFLK
jgi:hypothetical protein